MRIQLYSYRFTLRCSSLSINYSCNLRCRWQCNKHWENESMNTALYHHDHSAAKGQLTANVAQNFKTQGSSTIWLEGRGFRSIFVDVVVCFGLFSLSSTKYFIWNGSSNIPLIFGMWAFLRLWPLVFLWVKSTSSWYILNDELVSKVHFSIKQHIKQIKDTDCT